MEQKSANFDRIMEFASLGGDVYPTSKFDVRFEIKNGGKLYLVIDTKTVLFSEYLLDFQEMFDDNQLEVIRTGCEYSFVQVIHSIDAGSMNISKSDEEPRGTSFVV